jgi:hypothetical protein
VRHFFFGRINMNTFRSRFLMVAGLAGTAGLLLNVNCGGGSSGGTGGTTGSGGTTSTGGKGGSSSGGSVGSGGSSTGGKGGSGTGGSATGGSGGSVSTGGSGGSGTGGGAGGTAGSGSGGAAGGGGGAKGGAGGAGNTDGGATTAAAFAFTFDKDTQGFGFNTFNPSAGGNVDDIDGGTKPTLTWDNTVGSPGSTPTGSLKLDVTFTDYNQFVLLSSGTKPWINGTGKTAQVWILLDAVDGGHQFAGGIQLEASSGTSFAGASGAYTTLTAGTWKEVTLPLTAAGSFDPAQLIQFSINFTTGSKPDGGTFSGPVHAIFHIDTLSDGGTPPAPLAPNATFDVNTQGFTATAATHPDGGAVPTVTFDSTTGNPSNGSIMVALPFSNYNQGYTVQSDVAPSADLSGKTIHAKVRLDKVDGGATTIPSGYVQLFVQSNGFKYANGPGAGFTAGTWTDLTLTVSTPSFMVTGYDPKQIIQVGVQFGTGGMPDGGVFGAEITPQIHVDTIIAQ